MVVIDKFIISMSLCNGFCSGAPKTGALGAGTLGKNRKQSVRFKEIKRWLRNILEFALNT